MNTKKNTVHNEIEHFTHLHHIWWGARTPAGQRRYDNKAKLFKKVCRIKSGMKILEVGAGDGEFTKRIVKIVPAKVTVVATDVTPAVVKRGKKEIKRQNLSFKVDNLEAMAFQKESFNIICGVSILHHINTKKAIKEIYRVLKKDGEMFFTEPNYINPHVYLGLHIKPFRERMEFSPDETAFKRWELEAALKKAGFSTVVVKNIDFLHPKTPKSLIPLVETISNVLEFVPFIKEISGTLMVYAKK